MNGSVDGPTINHINNPHIVFINWFMKIILVQSDVDGPIMMDVQCRLLLQEIHQLHDHLSVPGTSILFWKRGNDLITALWTFVWYSAFWLYQSGELVILIGSHQLPDWHYELTAIHRTKICEGERSIILPVSDRRFFPDVISASDEWLVYGDMLIDRLGIA